MVKVCCKCKGKKICNEMNEKCDFSFISYFIQITFFIHFIFHSDKMMLFSVSS